MAVFQHHIAQARRTNIISGGGGECPIGQKFRLMIEHSNTPRGSTTGGGERRHRKSGGRGKHTTFVREGRKLQRWRHRLLLIRFVSDTYTCIPSHLLTFLLAKNRPDFRCEDFFLKKGGFFIDECRDEFCRAFSHIGMS